MEAGTQAADGERVPEDDAVRAATALADPGETVTFTPPSAPGDYRQLWPFLGHYASVRGMMKVVSS